jgi:hypothetical protein
MHDAGLACDFTIYDQRYEKVAYAMVDKVIARMGLTDQLTVKKNPKGGGSTGDHVHIEVKVKKETPITTMASAENDKIEMVVMGDSLAQGLCGVWKETSKCYAKTGKFLRRIPAEAIAKMPTQKTLVLWAGTNDAVADWGNFDMLSHINLIMSQLNKYDGKVIWLKVPPATPAMKQRIDMINMMIETANENFPMVKVLDASTLPQLTKGKDSIHYTLNGYKSIAQFIEQES